MKQNIFLFLLLAILRPTVSGQGNIHPQSTKYTWPADPQVLEKLEKWQDMKFGMIIHWGLYAVPGIIESWSICSEDWIYRDSTSNYNEYKQWYFGLKDSFNPTQFSPEQWASTAKNAGMHYLVFTTKHHDGFCMWNTGQTDFKITSGPFSSNPRSDVAKYVFEAFRKEGLMIGAYFSKPDWHSEYYWWPRYATPNRNNNYDIRKNPWRWQQFKNYTYNQIRELMTNYGPIDILWLDGGWVRPLETVNKEVISWGAPIPEWNQDIDIPKIASMARKAQPGLLIVDRTVHGPYENYQTPEQHIPDSALSYPWESCITLGNNWGFVPGDQFKAPENIIRTLIEIVAKGGNMLLGVGPNAEGLLLQEQIDRLNAIGSWLGVNGEAIYNTRTVTYFRDKNTFFTRTKNSKKYFALVCFDDKAPLQKQISWRGNIPKTGSEIILLSTQKPVKWKVSGDKVVITLPGSVMNNTNNLGALAFSFTPEI
jgi:alpha-L-fucosidase